MKIRQEDVIADFAEVLNNLNDDLQMETKDSDDGYKTHREVVNAVKKFTLKVLCKKYKKYGGKLMIDN